MQLPFEAESFSEFLPDYILKLMFATSPFEDHLWPVFNAARFPVVYEANGLWEPKPFLQKIFDQRKFLSLHDCQEYNRWLINQGLFAHKLPNIRGVCTKTKETCKSLGKGTFVCKGCGITWLPGSLVDPNCVVYPDPWWADYIREEITIQIAANNGPSKTDSLVWFPTGVKKHGRTVSGHES